MVNILEGVTVGVLAAIGVLVVANVNNAIDTTLLSTGVTSLLDVIPLVIAAVALIGILLGGLLRGR
jgi:hypothetical protein